MMHNFSTYTVFFIALWIALVYNLSMGSKQLSLFPTDDYGDHSFEFKRAAKVQKRADLIGTKDLLIILPRRFVTSEFAVSRTTGDVWWCQDCHPNANCRHITAFKELLRVKPAEYNDIEWLRRVLPVGEIK
jgi:hypothetical protein